MRVLITGGSGFIGQAVSTKLKADGHSVTVLDVAPPAQRDELFVQGSVLDESILSDVVNGHDVVLHAAAVLGVENCFEHPQLVSNVNVRGTANVIHAVRAARTPHLVFVSSSEVYGNGNGKKFDEAAPLAPITLYGQTKVQGEIMLQALPKDGLSATVVRLFNAYGPGQRADFVVPRFVSAALAGKPLTIYGTGQQNRTFTFIDDVAAGICAAVSQGFVRGPMLDIYNIGSVETMTILELAATIKLLTGSASSIEHLDLDSGSGRRTAQEILYRVPDTRKARQELGFVASVGIRSGLSSTIRASSSARTAGHSGPGPSLRRRCDLNKEIAIETDVEYQNQAEDHSFTVTNS